MRQKFYSIFFIFITFVFSGCIQNITPKGLTVKVPTSQIAQSLERQFPVSKDFSYGKVSLENPKVMLRAGSDRVETGAMINLSSAFIPTQTGSLIVSGKPFFDAQSGSVYLREPNVERLQFNDHKLESFMKGPLNNIIVEIANEIFRTTPIYQVNKSSFRKSFVNDIRVSNGELLINFGL